MVEQLERDGRETGAVELRTLSEATFPTVPATPHRLINLVIGLAVGAVAASVVLLATALRHFLLRRRTRSQWAYVELDGEPKLALVHVLQPDEGGRGAPTAEIRTLVEPLRGTTPGAVSVSPGQEGR